MWIADRNYARWIFDNYKTTTHPHTRAFRTIWWFAIGANRFDPGDESQAERRLSWFFFDKILSRPGKRA